MKTAQPSAKERLLQATAILFYNDGIAATGIDAIVKKAGVAKKSLYNNFDSKADLVAAYLEQRHQEWLELYQRRLKHAHTPTDRVLAIFLAYADHAEFAYEKGFRGCGLLNAAAELDAQHPGRATVRRHKEEIQDLLRQHLKACFPEQPDRVDELSWHLSFLLEGAMARAGLETQSRCVHTVQHIAKQLLIP